MRICLTSNLAAFAAANSGEGTLFPTPDEFVAAVLQEKRERLEVTTRYGFPVAITGEDSGPPIGVTSPGRRVSVPMSVPRTRMAKK